MQITSSAGKGLELSSDSKIDFLMSDCMYGQVSVLKIWPCLFCTAAPKTFHAGKQAEDLRSVVFFASASSDGSARQSGQVHTYMRLDQLALQCFGLFLLFRYLASGMPPSVVREACFKAIATKAIFVSSICGRGLKSSTTTAPMHTAGPAGPSLQSHQRQLALSFACRLFGR